jgi:hypothetical protein
MSTPYQPQNNARATGRALNAYNSRAAAAAGRA